MSKDLDDPTRSNQFQNEADADETLVVEENNHNDDVNETIHEKTILEIKESAATLAANEERVTSVDESEETVEEVGEEDKAPLASMESDPAPLASLESANSSDLQSM